MTMRDGVIHGLDCAVVPNWERGREFTSWRDEFDRYALFIEQYADRLAVAARIRRAFEVCR